MMIDGLLGDSRIGGQLWPRCTDQSGSSKLLVNDTVTTALVLTIK